MSNIPISFKGFLITENAYVMIDPFSAQDRRLASGFLQLGGDCANCNIMVCLDCSVFYSRFCTLQGYIFWPSPPPWGGKYFCPNWKTGKNLKEDLKKRRKRGAKKKKRKKWYKKNRLNTFMKLKWPKKIHKNREEF